MSTKREKSKYKQHLIIYTPTIDIEPKKQLTIPYWFVSCFQMEP